MATLNQLYKSTRSIERFINSALPINKFIKDLEEKHAALSKSLDFATYIAKLSSTRAAASLGFAGSLGPAKLASAASIISGAKIASISSLDFASSPILSVDRMTSLVTAVDRMSSINRLASSMSSEPTVFKILGSPLKNDFIPRGEQTNSILPYLSRQEISIYEEESKDFLLYWSTISVLDTHEATCLLLKRNPEHSYYDRGYLRMLKFIQRAQLSNELEEWIKPKDLLIWAQKNGLNFPKTYASYIRRSNNSKALSFKEKKEEDDKNCHKISKKTKSLHKSKKEAYETLLNMLDSLVQEIKDQLDPKAFVDALDVKMKQGEGECLHHEEVAYLCQLQQKMNLLLSANSPFENQTQIIDAIDVRCPSCKNLAARTIEDKFAKANNLFEMRSI